MTLIFEVSGISTCLCRRSILLDLGKVSGRVTAMRLCATEGCSMSMPLLTKQKAAFRGRIHSSGRCQRYTPRPLPLLERDQA
jgi:hypothetical protein